MKKAILIISCALSLCACSDQCKDCTHHADAAKPTQKTAVKAAVKEAVKTVAEAPKVVEAAAKDVYDLNEIAKLYKKAEHKIGVLSVTPDEKNIVLSFGANDGLKDQQKILLFKFGKPQLEVVVTELSDEQISATYVDGGNPKVFGSGDALEWAILITDAK